MLTRPKLGFKARIARFEILEVYNWYQLMSTTNLTTPMLDTSPSL